jgi:4-carboxymuconolactone decarboxylase
MAHMQGVEPAEAGWFTRLVYWFVRRKLGKLTGQNRRIEPVKVAAHHRRLLRAIGQMEGGLDAARSVPAELKRLATLEVAMLIGCPFCIDLNSAVGRGEGVSAQQLADVVAFERSSACSELGKWVLRYAVALTRTPADIPEELCNSLREHCNPQQLVELTSALTWENFRARFNRGFGIEAEGFTAGAACPSNGAVPAAPDRGASDCRRAEVRGQLNWPYT